MYVQMHNTRRLIQGSFLGALIDFEPTHELHTEFGCVVLFGAVLHAAGWIANLSAAGQGKFIYMSTVWQPLRAIFRTVLMLRSVLPCSIV
jgi:hypothetical protein